MKPLLLELGCEELPPSVIPEATIELATRMLKVLDNEGIPHGGTRYFCTPRRLAIRVDDVATERPPREVEIIGPPRHAAFDAFGQPTSAAIGFAKTHNRNPADLLIRQTEKGEYVYLRLEKPPIRTAEILRKVLPQQLHLQFARPMRWQEEGTYFARPIRWLLCLLGEEVVPIEFAGLIANNLTFGHRNCVSSRCVIHTPDEYETVLAEHLVIASPQSRRRTLIAALNVTAEQVGGKLYHDPSLVEETVNTVEWPVPVLGQFDNSYLQLPPAVLVTTLRRHQRCFAVVSTGGRLIPFFIAVSNTPNCNRRQVKVWYEKAVDSRLRDAQFFVEADLNLGLEPLLEQEKRVIWLEGMGTLFDKTQRIRQLCSYLAQQVPAVDVQVLDRAALLCKADLLTQVVREKEFASLQGEMGGFYAKMLGEPAEVSTAISMQYWPEHFTAGIEKPKTASDLAPEARLLAIADKTDNIVGSFLAGFVPSGSEDPLGLRRQGIDILRLIQSGNMFLNVEALANFASGLFPRSDHVVMLRILDFFRERVLAFLAEANIEHDIVEAVTSVHWQTPTAALACARALNQFRTRPEFERLIIGQKRVANILKGMQDTGLPEEHLLTEPAEVALWQQALRIRPEVDRLVDACAYSATFDLLLELRPAIDKLFDEVLVMSDDLRTRENRLRLLQYVRAIFMKVADLSRIVIQNTPTKPRTCN